MILAVEGIDGCGKTSVVAAVVDELTQRHGYRARSLVFPDRQTYTGQVIDAHLRSTVGAPGWLDPYSHQALQVVNGLERLPELRDETWVNVLSRYTPSGYVYGRLDGCDRQWLERVTSALPPADLSVLLAVNPATAFRRVHERGVTSDVYERKGIGWFHEAENLYEGLWTAHESDGNLVGFGVTGEPDVLRVPGAVSSWMRLDSSRNTPEPLARLIVASFLQMFSCPCGKLHNPAKTPCVAVTHG